MKLPRFRFRIRTLLWLVALAAVALAGHRLYLDGPETHWLLLKLRYGNVEARRSAAAEAGQSEFDSRFHNLLEFFSAGPANPRTAEAHRSGRQRRAELLLPALAQAANDPDAGCRASALTSLEYLATVYARAPDKTLVLRQILAATQDHDDSVRVAAVSSLASLANRDTPAVINALSLAFADPSVAVRQAAARALGMLGAIVPQTQPDAASILVPLLASREDSRVRIKAAWGLCFFGADHRRHPAGAGPDVVPALVAALHDPDAEVRRTATVILGLRGPYVGGRQISSWDRRKALIIPSLKAGIFDVDKTVREGSALALFAFGMRDPAVIELFEQAARNPDRFNESDLESALKEWREEQDQEQY